MKKENRILARMTKVAWGKNDYLKCKKAKDECIDLISQLEEKLSWDVFNDAGNEAFTCCSRQCDELKEHINNKFNYYFSEDIKQFEN